MIPATSAGTSIAALSVSSVTSGSSTSTLSPAAICTSMTSTSSKSPRSGTTNGCLPPDLVDRSSNDASSVVAPDGGGAIAGVMTTVSLTSMVNLPITSPVDTVSPTLTDNASITPFSADGMSMEALSVSTVIRPSSRSTVSPTLTRISITSISSKSPRSGITMSIVFAMFASAAALQRHRVGAIRIDAVFFDGVGDRLLVENAIVGERLQCRYRDITFVDFKVLA